MDSQEEQRQDVERIKRRAEEFGHDPARVERALQQSPPAPVEYQAVMEVQPRRSWLGTRLARRLDRRT